MRGFLVTIERFGKRALTFEALAADLRTAQRQHAGLAGPGERVRVTERPQHDEAWFMRTCELLRRSRAM